MLKTNSQIGQMCIAALVCAVNAGSSFSLIVAADTLPRYKFHVGQELVYRNTEVEDLLADKKASDKPKPPATEGEWRIYVVRENDDGSWRLLMRRKYKSYSLDKDKRPEINFENDYLGYVDLHTDGKYAKNDSLGTSPIFQLQPHEIFLQLPSDQAAMSGGWQYDDPAGGGHYAFKAPESAERELVLT
ncbi:MAG: hypothetical protein WD971_07235, partial [Pirellulales bacterium]